MAKGSIAGIGVSIGMRLIARVILKDAAVTTHGLDVIPPDGPVILALRHYHHLYDGAAIVAALHRPLHVFVALDWAPDRRTRHIMEWLCRTAGWPVGLRRSTELDDQTGFKSQERWSYMKRALQKSADILERGGALGIFPEGRPVIDPHGAERINAAGIEPFSPGLCAIVEQAQRAGGVRIPIVPIGLSYHIAADGNYHITLRAGAPVFHAERGARRATLADLKTRVADLSQPHFPAPA